MTTSPRPYLLRAFHEWMTDNSFTPHIVVDAVAKDVQVPRNHVREGKITLNIAYHAVKDLQLGNDWISFNARFGGVAQTIFVPVYAVLAVYAKETGHGMEFGPEPAGDDAPPPPTAATDQDKPAERPKGKPTLRRVK